MKKYFILIFSIITIRAQVVEASLSNVEKMLRSKNVNNLKVASSLVDEGFYFSVVPFIKEALAESSGVSTNIDKLIDRIVTKVGVKQFEVLPTKILKKSNSSVMRYILAKKYFRYGVYNKVINLLSPSVLKNNEIGPFASSLLASSFSILKKYDLANKYFKECIAKSESAISQMSDKDKKRQLSINRDVCVVGIPRTYFSARDFQNTNSTYLDLPKSSHIWPEILFEEAWNSFYMSDYNRTLGKLVTYNAPVFSHIFNPEIEVLKALTYFKLCLYSDTYKIVEDFYSKYQKELVSLGKFLDRYGKNYKYYYLISRKRAKDKSDRILTKLLKDIERDATYREMYTNFSSGKNELDRVKSIPKGLLRSVLARNLKESLVLQRDLIGVYVRKKLRIFKRQIEKSLEGMSYIKLEIIKKRREIVMTSSKQSQRTRGDEKNLKITDKQYFWSFNGEFWADELGDYVFSLESNCN